METIERSIEEIIEAQKTVLLKNDFDEAYIRPIIYLGNESLGLRAEVIGKCNYCSMGMALIYGP